MRLCCRIKLPSWPEGILQKQKAAELKGSSKGDSTQKPNGKEASKKCWEANWNIREPTLVTDNISSNPGIMQAEPGPKYPRDLVLAGPQHCGHWDPGYINPKEHLYNGCMARAGSHWHPMTPQPLHEAGRLSSLAPARPGGEVVGYSGALGNLLPVPSSDMLKGGLWNFKSGIFIVLWDGQNWRKVAHCYLASLFYVHNQNYFS